MATARRASARQVLTSGSWKGVRDTLEPFDDTPDLLVDLQNGYIPDPQGGSAVFARPGFELLNGGSPVFSSGSPFRGQGIYSHTNLDGTTYNFAVFGGTLYRVNNTFTTFTDVTPAAPIAISAAITTRIKFVTLDGQLVVSDGVNRVWVASNLSSTPITGTNIDYDGAGVAWCAQDITVWGGAIVAVLKTVNSVARQSDISWSEPGTPAIGWQQLNFDNNWTLEQTGSSPLYAVAGTNVALYYFRQRSIGAITGAIGPDLATTSTHDSISYNVGTQAPQSVQLFGTSLFFTDALGRPWRLPAGGGPPEAIWLNMRAIVDNQTTAFPAITQVVTTATFEPTLNLYLVAVWSPTPASQTPAIEVYVFDARLGSYLGRWTIGVGQTGIALESIGVFLDQYGRSALIVQGSKDPAPATGGYMWSFNSLSAIAAFIDTEGLTRITTEGGLEITTEGQAVVWTDNGAVPYIAATTQRMGYSADAVWNVDKCVVITGTATPVSVTVQTPTTMGSLQGICTPTASADGTYRCVVSTYAVGRGAQVTVRPTTATSQWSLDRVQLIAVPSSARPEDP